MRRRCSTSPFEQRDAGGNTYVERSDFAVHGDFDEDVAVAGDEFMEARAFGSDDHDGGQVELDLIVLLGSVFGEPVDPVAFFLEFFEGLGDVADADDGHMGECAGGGLGGDFGDRGGAAVWEEDGVGTGGMGGADDGAEIMGIFNAVKQDEKLGGGRKFRKLGVALTGGKGDDTLVGGGFAGAVESLSWLVANRDIRLFSEVNDQLHLRATGAFGDQNTLDGLTGAERLGDGMDT